MKYNQPYGVSDPNGPYINGDPSIGRAGSIPPAASIEYPQREIVNYITDANKMTPDNADLHQLAKTVQSLYTNFAIDQGTVNALSVAVSPPIAAYYDGLHLWIKAAAKNSGATTLSVNGGVAAQVVRRDGTQLLAGDIQTHAIQGYVYEGSSGRWQLDGAGVGASAGIQTSNLDIYVNYAIGNDANDGTANVAGKALQTIQAGVNKAYSFAPSQWTTTIHVADSPNYPGFYTPAWAGPNLNITGNVANPQNVVVTGNNTHACLVQGLVTCLIQGLTATTTVNAAGPGGGFIAVNSANLTCRNNRNLYVYGAVFEASQANIEIGPHIFAGNCGEMYWAGWTGLISWDNATTQNITVPITVTFAAAYAAQAGTIQVPPSTVSMIGYANVTGKKYLCSMNGTIGTSGGGVNFFPGTVAGTTDTGGQYL
jgi:hypothetical protein